jgi:hypothetical protein
MATTGLPLMPVLVLNERKAAMLLCEMVTLPGLVCGYPDIDQTVFSDNERIERRQVVSIDK